MNAKATVIESSSTAAAQGATAAPQSTPAQKGAHPKQATPQSHKAHKRGKAKAAAPQKAAPTAKQPVPLAPTPPVSAPRAQSKGATILDLIGRANGATLAEIMQKTLWQPHSVRGFLSNAAHKYGLHIESTKNTAGDRVYQIKK